MRMPVHKTIHMVTFLLLVVGGLNWLAFALLGTEVSAFLGGPESVLAKGVFVLVGLSAIYELLTHKQTCKMCASGASGGSAPAQ
jgi:uncharacterized membrane protein YuzA (DUF378 family)